MTKFVLFSAFSMILSLNAISQIVFEKGYFVDESGQKTECLIKNLDWRNSPTEFQYKLSEDTEVAGASIETVREFGVNNVSKWVRASVDVDQSSDALNRITSDRNPVFEERTIFLKVLVEGKASLFVFQEANTTRFFYSKDDSDLKPLVYKRYLVGNNVASNNYFRQQLASELLCQSTKPIRAGNLMYAKRDLEKYFTRYNECHGANSISYEPQGKRDLFDLSIKVGINHSSLSVNNAISDSKDFDFDNEVGFRLALGFEYTLPFNKNKWGIFLEPAYQYYSSQKIQKIEVVSGGELTGLVDYQSVEIAMGVRHYFFLNDKSKIFADVSYVADLNAGSEIEFLRSHDGSRFDLLDIGGGKNLGFGLGYEFMDKFSVGFRYQSSRNVLGDYVSWDSNYTSTSVMLGYSLF